MTDEIEQIIESARLAGTRLPPQLLKYWVAGAGAAKIGWGTPHDFYRCRREIQAEVSEKGAPLAPNVINGLCATLHKIATGASPGHAPGESGRADMADSKKPYGDVSYADPGYQKDGKKRYPIDTEEHAKAAWSYINQGGNSSPYSADQLARIKGKIRAALKRFGVTVSASQEDEMSAEVLKALGLPEDADEATVLAKIAEFNTENKPAEETPAEKKEDEVAEPTDY